MLSFTTGITPEGDTTALAFKKGDVNLDGAVNVKDVTMMIRATLKMVTFSDRQKALADVDGKSGVTIQDVTFVQRYIAEFSGGYGTAGSGILT